MIIFTLAFSILLGLAATTESADQQTFDLQLFDNPSCFGQPRTTVTLSLAELNIAGSQLDEPANTVPTFNSARIANVNSNLFGQNLVVAICDKEFGSGPDGEARCYPVQPGILRLTNDADNCAENQQIQNYIFQFCPFGAGCENTDLNP